MAERNYSPLQTAKINQLVQAHADFVTAKANLEAEVRAQVATKLRDLELRESRLMNEALNSGVTKAKIARCVGTQFWPALEAKYALTADEYFTPEARVETPEFTIDRNLSRDGHLWVTLNWKEFDGVRHEVEWLGEVYYDWGWVWTGPHLDTDWYRNVYQPWMLANMAEEGKFIEALALRLAQAGRDAGYIMLNENGHK